MLPVLSVLSLSALAYAPGSAPKLATSAARLAPPQLALSPRVEVENKASIAALARLEQYAMPTLRNTLLEVQTALEVARQEEERMYAPETVSVTSAASAQLAAVSKEAAAGATVAATKVWEQFVGLSDGLGVAVTILAGATQAAGLVAVAAVSRVGRALALLLAALLRGVTPRRAAFAVPTLLVLLGVLPAKRLPTVLAGVSNWAGSFLALPFELLLLLVTKLVVACTGVFV